MADPQQPGSGAQGATFTIDRIYVKDLSLENPGSPQSFMTQEQPNVEVGLRTRGEQIQPDIYECVLTVTLTAKVGDKTLFLIEASQAGIFTHPRRSGRASAAGDCDQLPDGALPLCARDAGRRHHARGLSSGPPRADQFRGALPAAAVGAGAGDPGRGQLTRLETRAPGDPRGERRTTCAAMLEAPRGALRRRRRQRGCRRGFPVDRGRGNDPL